MRKPRAVEPAIKRVQPVLDGLAGAIAAPDRWQAEAAPFLERLTEETGLLGMPRYASHAPHLAGLRAALEAGDQRAANRYLHRLRAVLKAAANDKPFAVGAPVSVVRSRHGWHDGSVSGSVSRRHVEPNGTVSYGVTGGDGMDYEIEHTRDLRPLGR